MLAAEIKAGAFAETSAYELCKQCGMKGQARTRALTSLSETAGKDFKTDVAYDL